MLDEKVKVVKMLLIKMAAIVPRGYSKSTDKIAQHILDQGDSEVNQFIDEQNDAIQNRRFLDPDKIKTRLKAEEEDEEKKGEEDDEEKKEDEKEKNPPKP